MRLLLVSQDFPPAIGGIQTYAWQLARELALRCEALHVVAPDGPAAAEADRRLGLPVHRVAGGSDALGVRAIPTIVRLARRERLDTAVHAQWMTAAGSRIGRGLGWPRRYFVAVHGRELRLRPAAALPPVQAAYDHARRSLLRAADGVLAVSRFSGGLARDLGVASGRVHVVPNGTDPIGFEVSAAEIDRFVDAHDLVGRRILLTLGRLVPHKGIDTVIGAIAHVRTRHPDVVYVVAGDGPDAGRLRELVARHDASAHVRFVGRLDDAERRAAFGACEAFVTLSREHGPSVEGFGVVFLEAAAAGRPVVGSRSGGIPDAVVDGTTGLLVAPDDPHAAVEAILALLEDPARARAMGRRGRERVRSGYTWSATAERIVAAIDDVTLTSRVGPTK